MQQERKYVMSIAGFDPSGGAGLLADAKTFEQHKVYGLSVCTANTLQTDNRFYSLKWTTPEDVLNAVEVLLGAYPVRVVKTGIVSSFDFLFRLVSFIKSKSPDTKIIVDPIFKSSTGFDFQYLSDENQWKKVLEKTDLITPNVEEALLLTHRLNAEEAAIELSNYCPVLLKGGHHTTKPGVDYLFTGESYEVFTPVRNDLPAKHGSGCVLSAAIASNLALGHDLRTACLRAKKYIEQFLSSNPSLLGFHHV